MIRPAIPRDYPAIRQIIAHAFGQDDEANLVEQLRADGDALVEFVAASEIALQGHILYSALAIEARRRDAARAAALAPVSVLPAFQRQGLGMALIEAGNAECRARAALPPFSCWGMPIIIRGWGSRPPQPLL
ncbi:MAG: hypothetical protein NVV62_11285 [Terricaulis sp.]|nr:hypothetical protein [Terricaulis sp.]